MDTSNALSLAQDASFDIPDATDWLGTPLVGLMPVEQAFRCHVCKDFYNSPMLTSCNHTFCSLCIRRSLAVDGKCPLCRMSDQESKLRGNWAMREAVDAFVKSRSAILEIARTPAPTSKSQSPKRKAAEMESPDSSQTKRTRMSARLSKVKGAELTTAMMRDEVEVLGSREPVGSEPNDGLVACPICLTRMKETAVDRHIDTSCPGTPQPPPKASNNRNTRAFTSTRPPDQKTSTAAKPPERLTALNYSLLKDQQLRKKLTELGISTAGSRLLMETRHKEWVTIWNANCDSARPKKRTELLRDLDVWERTLGGRASGAMLGGNAATQVKDKEFDGAAWAARHDDSFRDLIASARRTRSHGDQKAKNSAAQPNVASASGVGGGIVGPLNKPCSTNDQPENILDLTGLGSSQTEAMSKESSDGGLAERDVPLSSEIITSKGPDISTSHAESPPPSSQLEVRASWDR